MFFVLSGYLVYRPMALRHKPIGAYLARRAGRILPAYLVALVGVTLLTGTRAFVDDPWHYLLFAQLYGQPVTSPLWVTWTLQVEVTFYLLLPAIALLVRGGLARLLVLGIGSCAVAYLTRYTGAIGTQAIYWFPFLFWSFAVGMVVAHVEARGRLRYRPWLAPVGLLLLVAGLTLDGGWLDPVIALGTSLLIAASVTRPRALPALRLPAEASYSFYLWHLGVIQAAQVLGLSGYPLAVVALVLTSAVSVASFYLVEERFLAPRVVRPRVVLEPAPSARSGVGGPFHARNP
jgi:peptidoglycan/LPS O-acetylase OafA/YrhL